MLEPAIFIVCCYIAIVILVYFIQGRLLYYPTKDVLLSPKDISLDYSELSLKSKDGLDISAWYIPVKNARGVVFFCHGNAGNISHRLDSIRIFNQIGMSVLIFDYRGYGKSKGFPSEEGTYIDAEAAWDYTVNVLGIRPEKIVLFGRSLGGAVATEIALRRSAAALILESSFKSVPDVGSKIYPWLPVRLISRYKYSTIEKIDKVGCPVLIVHSPTDEIIPFTQGVALFEKAIDPKEFLEIYGGHNEGFILSEIDYKEGLKRFIHKYLPEETEK